MKRKHPTASLALPAMLGCLLGVVLIFAAVACQEPAGGGGEPRPECTTDEDCPDGQICEDGVCVAAPACTTDEDCPDGQICQDGVCVAAPACTTDEDCPDGQICQDGVCVAGPVELRFPYRTTAFDHAPHMTDFGLACTDCHHTEPANAAGQACSACHADEWIGGVPKLKEAMHTTTGEETGNSGCRSCHAQTTEDGSWQCSFCHTELNDL